MRKLGVHATARASVYLYNTTDEIDRLVEGVDKAQRFFGTDLKWRWTISIAK